MAESTSKPTPIIIRKSAVLMLARLFILEVGFIVCYLLLTLPVYFTDTTAGIVGIFNLYVIAFVLLSLIKIFFMTAIILSWVNEYYTIQPGVLVHRQGILRTEETIFTLNNVESENIHQSIWGRLLDFGTIELYNPLLKERCDMRHVPSPRTQLEIVKDNSLHRDEWGRIIPLHDS